VVFTTLNVTHLLPDFRWRATFVPLGDLDTLPVKVTLPPTVTDLGDTFSVIERDARFGVAACAAGVAATPATRTQARISEPTHIALAARIA
jgi:hypothetical protein